MESVASVTSGLGFSVNPRRTSVERALAGLVQVLLFGEETAAVAFAVLAHRQRRRAEGATLATALAGIATDEREHERLLRTLLQTLPPAELDGQQRSVSAKFFRSLAGDSIGEHLTRIAALDSAVCQLLGALRSAQPALFGPALRRILHDEARHVAASSAHARLLLSPRVRREQAAATRAGLVQMLLPWAHCLETLHMDPERLLLRLGRPPRFIYS